MSGRPAARLPNRSAVVMPGEPPVVNEISASQRSRIPVAISANSSGEPVGRPSSASRAWTWMQAAPASAARTASAMIASAPAGIAALWLMKTSPPVMAAVRTIGS